MPGMLIAYDEDGNIIATRDFQNVYDPDTGEPLGTIDFMAAEDAGMEMTEFWRLETWDLNSEGERVLRDPQPVKGSKAWPEYLGGAAHQFRVILGGPPGNKRIVNLVHRKSGHERKRADVEAAISERKNEAKAKGKPADLRDLVGGPDRPLKLDEKGKTRKPGKNPLPAWAQSAVVRPTRPDPDVPPPKGAAGRRPG